MKLRSRVHCRRTSRPSTTPCRPPYDHRRHRRRSDPDHPHWHHRQRTSWPRQGAGLCPVDVDQHSAPTTVTRDLKTTPAVTRVIAETHHHHHPVLHTHYDNLFNDPLSRMTRLSQYQKNTHSLTTCLCDYNTTSLIPFCTVHIIFLACLSG